MTLILILLAALAGGAVRDDPVLLRCSATAFDVDLYGRFAIADAREGTVTLLAPDGTVEAGVGGIGWGNAQFDRPAALWFRNGIDLFVADYHNHRIQRFDRSLNFVSSFSTRDGDVPGERFGYPADVALSRLGELFICDTENARVLQVNRQNTVVRTFGGIDAGKGRLRRPTALELGPGDRVYVLDGDRILVYDTFGNHVRTLGAGLLDAEPVIAADAEGLAVVSGATLLLFDRDDRPAGAVPLADLGVHGGTEVRAAAIAGEHLYLLTGEGILALRGARTLLDKEGNNE